VNAQCPVKRTDAVLDPREGTIVVVESSIFVGRELVEQLRADRYRAVLAHTAEHARVLAREQPVRAIVLGALETPHGSLDLLEEIRRGASLYVGRKTTQGGLRGSVWDEQLPVIVLGQGGGQLELLRAFEMGADDFTFRVSTERPLIVEGSADSPDYLELRARLRAVLRRSESQPGKRFLCAGPLEIDTDAHLVRIGVVPVELCRLEYELLVYLAASPTEVCSKQELLRAIWKQRTGGGARTVDSHASRLRRKLAAAGASGLVVNVWGVGYRLV
jgi:DNA-binding response OmpR family regulator